MYDTISLTPFLIFFTFVLGTIIGSFLNVVALRFNTGKTVGGRSSCMTCARKLSWYDMLPVASWFVLRGKCRSCRSAISFQYPLVELVTGVLFAAVAYKYELLLQIDPVFFIIFTIFMWVSLSILVVITIYDLRHQIIPDQLSFAFAILGLARIVIDWGPTHLLSSGALWDIAGGILIAFFFYFLWRVSNGAWMGLGDAKLALGIGWFLGLREGVSAIVMAFWIGCAICLAIIAYQRIMRKIRGGKKGLGMGSEIPFAPFIIAGFLVIYFTGLVVY